MITLIVIIDVVGVGGERKERRGGQLGLVCKVKKEKDKEKKNGHSSPKERDVQHAAQASLTVANGTAGTAWVPRGIVLTAQFRAVGREEEPNLL